MKNPDEDIAERIAHIRQVEADLIQSPDKQFRFHSGVPA
jgi:tRNA-(ms[2]io[6]A)-hydroxylase